jgi:diguanylate cyclase (GGDEF)-like protein
LRARSFAEARDLAVTLPPSIVIAQAESAALELCSVLRSFEEGKNIYFILATADRDPDRLLAAFDIGVDDYLFLPCTQPEARLRLRAAQRVLDLRARLAAQQKTLQQSLAELAVANRKLHRAAMTDELTQLPNRRLAEELLQEEWTAATERDLELSLILGDIDHFKKINDNHGHLVGDLVLTSVARSLRSQLRATDQAFRLAGDEFLILCPNTSLDSASRCAERLCEKVASTAIRIGRNEHRVTISVGVASRRGGGAPATSVASLLQAADEAAYESKRAGRNRVRIAPGPSR